MVCRRTVYCIGRKCRAEQSRACSVCAGVSVELGFPPSSLFWSLGTRRPAPTGRADDQSPLRSKRAESQEPRATARAALPAFRHPQSLSCHCGGRTIYASGHSDRPWQSSVVTGPDIFTLVKPGHSMHAMSRLQLLFTLFNAINSRPPHKARFFCLTILF